jgi:uncharacterized membrane protein
MAEIAGYFCGVFFSLVIIGFILYFFNKLLGGIKWSLAAVGLLILMAAYTHFPIITTIIVSLLAVALIAYKFSISN